MKRWWMYRFYLPAALAFLSMAFHQRERDVELPLLAKVFSQYSGTGTGYGFFGPRVGSVYTLEVDCYDHLGVLIARLAMPPLVHAEGMNRYATFLDIFEALIADGTTEDGRKQRYARAVAQSVARRMVRLHAVSPHRIQYRVGVSQPPQPLASQTVAFAICHENSYIYTDWP